MIKYLQRAGWWANEKEETRGEEIDKKIAVTVRKRMAVPATANIAVTAK